MNRKSKAGFTLVELLTVIAILALLMGILIPVVRRAQIRAKEAGVTAQIQALSTGLETFKSDFGYYPSSVPQQTNGIDAAQSRGQDEPPNRMVSSSRHLVQGFHRLAFALLGRDRLGCPAKKGETGTLPSTSSNPGPDSITGWYYSDSAGFTGNWRDMSNASNIGSQWRTARKGPYINPDGFTVVKDLVVDPNGYAPVLCDRFSKMKPATDNISTPTAYTNGSKFPSVILYFAANERGVRSGAPTGGTLSTLTEWQEQTYYPQDNWRYTSTTGNTDNATFRGFINNESSKIGNDNVSYNRETYLLISAGSEANYFSDANKLKNWGN